MNFSRGRDRDRTARQVKKNIIILQVNNNKKQLKILFFFRQKKKQRFKNMTVKITPSTTEKKH